MKKELKTMIFHKMDQAHNSFDQYANMSVKNINNFFVCLKGWSSSTPLISKLMPDETSNVICRGGGYFLKWMGKGIVIDPGFDFVFNFHKSGYHIKEVDYIIITHDHLDHNADLRLLHDLLYQYNSQVSVNLRRKIDCIFDLGTFQSELGGIIRQSSEIATIYLITPNKTFDCGDFKISTIKTSHSVEGFGFRMDLLDPDGNCLAIGFTSDTGFFQGITDFYKGCDVLVPHLSFVTKEDIECETFKKNHLGYYGTKQLISEVRPSLTMVVEFWGGMADLRTDLIALLQEEINPSLRVIAGDVGCTISLAPVAIRCSCCGTFIELNRIWMARPPVPFGKVLYICDNCLL